MATVRKFDACIPRPDNRAQSRQGAVWWHRIGNAIENERGSITIFLNSLPISDDQGNFKICLFVPDEDRLQQDRGNVKGNAAGKYNKPSSKNDTDDEIPF